MDLWCIGPTHDDVTIKAVAEAFKSPLEVNQNMLEYLYKLDNAVSNSDDAADSYKTRYEALNLFFKFGFLRILFIGI